MRSVHMRTMKMWAVRSQRSSFGSCAAVARSPRHLHRYAFPSPGPTTSTLASPTTFAHPFSTTMGTLSSKSTPGTDSAPASGPVKEGMIPFTVDGETFQTYYKTVGTLEDRTKRPLVVLHGGPGFSHDYMLPIGDLATYDRPVIFYDQIGSGRSTALPDKGQEFWTFDLFVDEAMNVVNHFGIADDFDIIGHSWGGILATELALRRAPPGLKHCVFTNTICVMKLYGMSRYEQCKQLPEWAQQELAKGFRDTPECRAAATEFAKLFQCRVNPQPAELAHSLNYGFNTLHIIRSMGANGMNGYDCIDRVHEIKVPCLMVNGRYDTCADSTLAPLFKSLPRVKWVKFESEHSSHTPFWEDRKRYVEVLDEFLGY